MAPLRKSSRTRRTGHGLFADTLVIPLCRSLSHRASIPFLQQILKELCNKARSVFFRRSTMSQPRVIITAPVPADLREQIAARCEIIDVPAGNSLVEALDKEQRATIDGIICTMRTKF